MVNIKDLTDSLDEQNNANQAETQKQAELGIVKQSGDKVTQAIDNGSKATVEALGHVKGDVVVTNKDLAKSQDVNQAVEAINKLNLTTFMQNEGLPQLAKNLENLSNLTQEMQARYKDEGLQKMSDQLGQVVGKLDSISKVLSKTDITLNSKSQKTIDNLSKKIDSIDFSPSVNVTAPDTKIVTTPVDLKPLLAKLDTIEKAISVETPENEIDLSPITAGLQNVVKTISSLSFPSSNFILPFKDQDGKAVQVKLNADGTLPITSSGGSGTQYAELVTTAPGTGTLALGRYKLSAPTLTDGQMYGLQLDVGGNLKVSILSDGVVSSVNSTIANLAGGAVFTGTSEDVSDYSAIQVSAFSSHVSATDGLSLQQSSDGSNWDFVDTYTIAAATGKVFSIQPSSQFFRLVYTNGATLTTSLRIKTVFHVIAPNPSSQRTADAYTNETDLTQTWSFLSKYDRTNNNWNRDSQGILKNDGTVLGQQDAALIAGSFLSVPFTTTTAQAVGTTDAANYSYVSIHQTTAGGSSVTTFQGSNDNTNWVSVALTQPSNTTSSPSTTGAASSIFSGALQFRYFRLNITGIASGTTAGTIVFFTNRTSTLTSVAGQLALNGTSSVAGVKTNNNAVPGATNIGALIGIANAAAPTYVEGNEVLASTDLSGNTRATLGTVMMASQDSILAAQSHYIGGSALNLTTYSAQISTNTTTTPTSSTAYVSSIVISVTTGGTTSTINIKDKQGTPLSLVAALPTTVLSAGDTVFNFQTPVKMTSGIDIITAGAAAATFSIFVNYYQ